MGSVEELINEAFEQGYKKGFMSTGRGCKTEKEVNQAYLNGVNDAWNCALKINSLSASRLIDIFGTVSGWSKYEPLIAMKKIKEYEDARKPLAISVGDEVYVLDKNYKSVVSAIMDDDVAVCITSQGKWHTQPIVCLNKTGKHYDIESILEGLRKNDMS